MEPLYRESSAQTTRPLLHNEAGNDDHDGGALYVHSGTVDQAGW